MLYIWGCGYCMMNGIQNITNIHFIEVTHIQIVLLKLI